MFGVTDYPYLFSYPWCVTISVRALHWTSRERTQRGEFNSVETTRLARPETRHDFLSHVDLLRVSLYERQG